MPIGPELPPHLAATAAVADNNDDDDEPTVTVGPGPQAAPAPRSAPAAIATSPPAPAADDDSDDDYAPALPPDLRPAPAPAARVVGPTMPGQSSYRDDDSDDDFGPPPPPAGHVEAPEDGVRAFMAKEEARRREVEAAAKPVAPQREAWMLVPPTSSDLLGALDPTKLKARQFARTAAPARAAPGSLWTETPAERAQRLADEVAGKRRRADAPAAAAVEEDEPGAHKRRRVEEALRAGVAAHTRAVRGATLVDMHAKEADAAEADANAPPPAIWDHSRDMSLGGRLMDDGARAKMLRDARGLGDRFGTGATGGFL